jgi:hypothetical protein
MDPIEKQELKRDAQRRLRSQHQRARLLRSRVVVSSLVAFAVLWGAVFVQMATGNDPVLGDPSSRIAKGSAHPHRHRAKPVVESGASTNSEELELVEEEFVEEEPAPVTTSQS